ncbi:DNA polymerase III subunit delta [Lactobacillus gasseri]|uniref:DNA polymerase III subunit delta n=1 Tax=Lactobacillus gasseri SV-16A-US TaxID=575604 RepID=A0AB34P2M3_LACGS|nr:DNA polymerase III subunit delta [Lactobacillus gasseri]KFL97765.1 DNA polymerase III, delta subunit [Lactobacillus gasseri SV-16A-US]QTH66457.1 DNA polymerase III subunit delta [Lactobacillus gasseri]
MTLISLFKQTNPKNANLLIQGPASFFNDYLVRNYLNQKKFSGLDQVIVDCLEDGLDELMATLTESSLFSSQKMVVVKNPFFLMAKVPQKYKKQIEKLTKIIEHLDDLEDIVIFVANYEKIDRRKKVSKFLLEHVNVVETSLKPYEVSGVIKAISKEEGYQITNMALQILMQRSDQVLDAALSNYLKLKNIVGEDKKITETLINENIDRSLSENIFEILTAAFNKNYQEATQRLDDHLREGASAIQLLAIFESQIEFLTCVKVLQNRRWSKDQITKELKVNPYRVKLAMENKVSLNKLASLLKQAIELDFRYKNGTYHGDEFLKLFLLKI